MNESDMNKLAEVLAARLGGSPSTASGSGVQRPKELDDPNTDPTLRASILEAYTGALMERPQATWSEAERRSLWEQSRSVLRGMGF